MPKLNITPEERIERRRRYMREYQRNRRHTARVELEERQAKKREEATKFARRDYMREYRRKHREAIQLKLEVEKTKKNDDSKSNQNVQENCIEVPQHKCHQTEQVNVEGAKDNNKEEAEAEAKVEVEVGEQEEPTKASRKLYMREYRRKRRQAALLKAREEEARQRIETTKTSRKFYMREYRRKRQQMALVEVEDTKARQCEEIYENVRKECTKNEPRNGQQATQAEMKKIEEEGENSRTQYMQENRRNPRRRRITGIKGQVITRRKLSELDIDSWSSKQTKL
ncbi:hypothetical protein F4703DRAFT_1848884 [Phycomyces blakesleeanus]